MFVRDFDRFLPPGPHLAQVFLQAPEKLSPHKLEHAKIGWNAKIPYSPKFKRNSQTIPENHQPCPVCSRLCVSNKFSHFRQISPMWPKSRTFLSLALQVIEIFLDKPPTEILP